MHKRAEEENQENILDEQEKSKILKPIHLFNGQVTSS